MECGRTVIGMGYSTRLWHWITDAEQQRRHWTLLLLVMGLFFAFTRWNSANTLIWIYFCNDLSLALKPPKKLLPVSTTAAAYFGKWARACLRACVGRTGRTDYTLTHAHIRSHVGGIILVFGMFSSHSHLISSSSSFFSSSCCLFLFRLVLVLLLRFHWFQMRTFCNRIRALVERSTLSIKVNNITSICVHLYRNMLLLLLLLCYAIRIRPTNQHARKKRNPEVNTLWECFPLSVVGLVAVWFFI